MPVLPRAASFVVLAFVATAGVAAIAACDGGPAPQQATAVPGRTVDATSTWARGDFGARAASTDTSSAPSPGARPSLAATAGPASSLTPDPLALADLLRAAPTAAPGATDPDGGTLIGSDTGVPGTASPVTVEEAPQRGKKSSVLLGAVAVQSEMASPAIEREARAQLYFPLVTRCRDAAGKILPPDAILLEFTIDDDGYIVPQTISATATAKSHAAAADCMRRELSGLPFRGPAGARGQQAFVKMTVPSVD